MSGGTLSRRALAVAFSALILAAMAWLSAAPVPFAGAESARLRLSWSARPERIEKCRMLSDEELAKLGEHMRQRMECEGEFATYALRVDIDGSRIHESIVRGAGLRNDRPIYLLEDFDVRAGSRRVHVTFSRREALDDDGDSHEEEAHADSGLSIGRAEREKVERARLARAAIPPRLELDTALAFTPGHVIVVTLDAERGVLQVVIAESRSK